MPEKNRFPAVLQPTTVRSGSIGGFVQDNVGGTMRANGGDYHGGSESLVVWPAEVAATLDRSSKNSGGPGGSNQEIFSQHGANLVPQPVPYDLFQITAPVNRQNRKPGDPCHTLARDNAAHAAVAIGLTTCETPKFAHEVQPTLTVPSPSGGGQPPAVAHAFYSTGGTHGVNQHPEVSPAVKVGSGLGIPSPPAVAFQQNQLGEVRCGNIAGTVNTNSNASGRNTPMAMQAMTVRRLTPRECERLQGFPDDYTLIPWRKKQAEDCPDGPRYRALGNSMAVNCMSWIGERIAKWEAEHER
jgi:DNA (cytosine-5)-methyltransferase 1